MLSRSERIIWGALAALVLASAAAAWWTADQWTPHARPWATQAWRKLTRPGPETLPRDKAGRPAPGASTSPAPQAQPRKCVRGGSVTYTDHPCPPGAQEQTVEGTVTTLPAQR